MFVLFYFPTTGRSAGVLESDMLRRILIWFTWIFAVVFIPIETYITWSMGRTLLLLSGYIVNVLGVGLMLWGVISLRRGRPYAEGLLATGWGWMTAVFWRGANLRYLFAARGETLIYGNLELWLAPVFTLIVAAALLNQNPKDWDNHEETKNTKRGFHPIVMVFLRALRFFVVGSCVPMLAVLI